MKTTAIRVGSAVAGLATLGSMLFIAAPAFASYNSYPMQPSYGYSAPQQQQASGPCTNRFSMTCIAQTWSWLDGQSNSYSYNNQNQYQNPYQNSYNNGYNMYPTYSNPNYGTQYNNYNYSSYPNSYPTYTNGYQGYNNSYGNQYGNQYGSQYGNNYPYYEYQDQYVATPAYSAYNYKYAYSF